MWRRTRAFRPFASGGGRTVAAILVTFALIFGLSVALSIMATDRSRGRAAVVQVADRQRTLAERYVQSILLVRAGEQADPATLASLLRSSAGRAARRRHSTAGAGGRRRNVASRGARRGPAQPARPGEASCQRPDRERSRTARPPPRHVRCAHGERDRSKQRPDRARARARRTHLRTSRSTRRARSPPTTTTTSRA